jgi:hypothetical protein
VDVCLDDPLDAQIMLGRFAELLVDIAARVDHHCAASGLIAYQVGRLRQAFQMVLCEDHLPSSRKLSAFTRVRLPIHGNHSGAVQGVVRPHPYVGVGTVADDRHVVGVVVPLIDQLQAADGHGRVDRHRLGGFTKVVPLIGSD